MSYESRTGAVLFAKNLDRIAFKPVFFVPSLSPLRGVAETHGGVMEPADHEWSFNGVRVCDGLDPEGNVIQFRELAHHQKEA